MATLTRREPGFIDAHRLYTLQGFYASSGVSPTRVREAARDHGIVLPKMRVGKRRFVRGSDAIDFIERLSQL